MPYLTPNIIPSGTFCRTVLIPDDLDWLLIVNGALSELCNADNFEQFGSVTPEETAERFQQMFFEFRDSECMPVIPIGTIMMYGAELAPPGWVLCDGIEVSRTFYADLFAVIGIIWGEGDGSTTFNLPNFIDRSPIGRGTYDIGQQAGAMTHTLTANEIPAHAHGQQIGSTPAFLGTGGTGRVAYSAVTTASLVRVVTDNAGGGAAHNNLHPIVGLNFMIYAGV